MNLGKEVLNFSESVSGCGDLEDFRGTISFVNFNYLCSLPIIEPNNEKPIHLDMTKATQIVYPVQKKL